MILGNRFYILCAHFIRKKDSSLYLGRVNRVERGGGSSEKSDVYGVQTYFYDKVFFQKHLSKTR